MRWNGRGKKHWHEERGSHVGGNNRKIKMKIPLKFMLVESTGFFSLVMLIIGLQLE